VLPCLRKARNRAYKCENCQGNFSHHRRVQLCNSCLIKSILYGPENTCRATEQLAGRTKGSRHTTLYRMKFPSLFGRTPSHRRFEYRPRFYDPQKEERAERDRRIREELALEQQKTETTSAGDYHSRIKGSFQRSRRRAKPSSETSAIVLRLAVLLFVSLFLIAYLTWGSPVLYVLLLAIPVWIYFRFMRRG
jgi:hypothetical protein